MDLMQQVFSPNSPVLSLGTDENEQRGWMYLYAGTMGALRNPRAHTLLADDAETAFALIAIIDYLVKALDSAQKQP